ncbi:MAG: zinc ribbon domain-containing protein [Clostridia bacterium]|nr:zinc ribbon domain-containing protein [Clostridia bacterium]
MASCPKCGAHLRLIDWKQHCPHCGANLVLYDLQERLMQDADIAEVQHYHFQKKIDRLKTAFVGSKPAIARIFTTLLPVGALFLPLAKLTLPTEFSLLAGDLTLLTVYNAVKDVDLGAFVKLSPALASCAVCWALSLVLALVHLALLTLACSPKAKIRGVILNAVRFLVALTPLILLLTMPRDGAVSGVPGIGAYLLPVLIAAAAVLDFYILWHPVEIVHKQCYVGGIPIEEYFEMEKTMTREEIRAEQYRRLQEKYDEKEAAAKAAEEAKEAHAHG